MIINKIIVDSMFNFFNTVEPEVIELGIIIIKLPEPIEQMAAHFNKIFATPMPEKENIQTRYHISLFQGRFPLSAVDELLPKLKHLVEDFTSLTIEMKAELKATTRHVFWEVQPNSALQLLHHNIVLVCLPYRQGMLQQFQDRYLTMSLEEQQQVDKFGVMSAEDKFNPHITIFYHSNGDTRVNELVKQPLGQIGSCKLEPFDITNRIALGQLGYYGQVIEIISNIAVEENYPLDHTRLV
ncbi:2'-5' RNA ligase family protein (plasmid) [Legionella sp. D16C41]|uniref:2'-5' RNA ligase family protein n=1 Tax=Legionella sp. D16C41 TaxID=3402688 RepID=UPI003AF97D5B